jgi:hypothetical protein
MLNISPEIGSEILDSPQALVVEKFVLSRLFKKIPKLTWLKMFGVVLAIAGSAGQASHELGFVALPGHWNMYVAVVGVVANKVGDVVQDLIKIFGEN